MLLLRLFCCALLVLIVCGCAARPGSELFAPVPPPAKPGQTVKLIVATDRDPDPARPGNFSTMRSARLHFASYAVSVPPSHKAMHVEWSGRQPVDPASSFALLSYAPLPDDSPLPAPEPPRNANATDGAERRLVVFVHGYNTNYAESVLRMTQLLADNPSPGQAILFAWPSEGSLPGYVADKDAVTFSRDHLTQLLTMLAEDGRYSGITLAGHSMGCWLVMESLRQLRLTGRDKVFARLDNVLLAAPDIDLDVFRAQAETVGRLNPPITVLASPDDRALDFSSRLGGDRYRLGELDVRDPRIQSLAEAYGFQLIDISNMAATDSLNHDRFIGAAAALKTVLSPRKSGNPLRRAGAYLLDAVASVMEVPGRIGRAAAEGVK
jgi:esterase/lipase superfamily enzyme